jgi:bifunctional NMN adenylyltransferase/nudix hydrolase
MDKMLDRPAFIITSKEFAMTKPFDFLVYIGRFQPFHNGHLAVIRDALTKADSVIVVIGSAHAARSPRNPFTASERKEMIRGSLFPTEKNRVHVVPVADHPYNYDKWLAEVQGAVHTAMFDKWRPDEHHVGLIGHKKDQSSEYLSMFPQWEFVETDSYLGLNATDIREAYFTADNIHPDFLKTYFEILPGNVSGFLSAASSSKNYENMSAEFKHMGDYKKQWASSPYPPFFKTADAVVVQSGHILMVTRKAMPGAGLMALPGGFVNEHETIKESMLRELREETRIKVPEPVLAGSITSVKTFDDPYRSSRGRTITTAFLVSLRADDKLPEVKGGDDAARAFWVPLASLQRDKLFEDHYDIVEYMVGL